MPGTEGTTTAHPVPDAARVPTCCQRAPEVLRAADALSALLKQLWRKSCGNKVLFLTTS